jgi:hypothetical protein
MTTNIGIQSINERLSRLEREKVVHPDSMYEKLRQTMNENKQKTQEEKFKEIQEHFQSGVIKMFGEVTMEMLSYFVEYTVVYIEKNIGRISDVLEVKPSSELKLNTAITFITEYLKDVSVDLLVNTINHMVSILFNRIERQEKIIQEKNSSCSRFGSIRRKTKKTLIP